MRFLAHISVVAVMAVCITTPEPAGAQSESVDFRRVTLVLNEAVGTPSPVMVYRRASGTDRDVIAVSRTSTVADLSRAFRVLDILYASMGDSLDHDVAAAARTERQPTRVGDNASERAKLHALFLNELRRSATRTVRGFGSVRALEVHVPRSGMRTDSPFGKTVTGQRP